MLSFCEFGEKMHYMPLKVSNVGVAPAEARYQTGISLGVDERSSERMVATEDGIVVSARSIERLPQEDRWDSAEIQNMRGAQWKLEGEDEALAVVFREHDQAGAEEPLPVRRPEAPVPRRLRLTKTDLDCHGYTTGCPGCEAQLANRRSGGHLISTVHTEECRARLLEAMRQTPQGEKDQ